jgi:hypothetical protein
MFGIKVLIRILPWCAAADLVYSEKGAVRTQDEIKNLEQLQANRPAKAAVVVAASGVVEDAG